MARGVTVLPARSAKMARCIDRSNCCYGIEWVLGDEGYLESEAHYNPPWRVQGVKNQGLPGLYTRDSAQFRFKSGEDFVGQVFLQQTSIFVEDLQSASQDCIGADTVGCPPEFSRMGLAKTYDIHSAAFFPGGKGVIEIGSTQRLTCQADLVADHVLSELLRDDTDSEPVSPACLESSSPLVTSSKEQRAFLAAVQPATGGSLRLQRLVEGSPACYGIEWVLDNDGCLKHRVHYNPPWRVEGVRSKGLKGLYTTGSQHCKFSPGESLVGKVFIEQKPVFVEDLQNHLQKVSGGVISEEASELFQNHSQDVIGDVISGEAAELLRCRLAKEYDIHSAMFLPLPEGVIEMGSTQQFHNAEDFVPRKLLRSVRLRMPTV